MPSECERLYGFHNVPVLFFLSTENFNTAVRKFQRTAVVYVLPVERGQRQPPGQLRLHPAVHHQVKGNTDSHSLGSLPSNVQPILLLHGRADSLSTVDANTFFHPCEIINGLWSCKMSVARSTYLFYTANPK